MSHPSSHAGGILDIDRSNAQFDYEGATGAAPERRESLLVAIVNSSDDAIISKDLEGIILTWNQAAGKIFGYSATEMVGQNIRRLIPDELQHEEEIILSTIRAGGRISHYETVRVRKNGERFEVSITISPLINHRGEIIGASKIAREITERKDFEKQLVQSEKLAASGRMAATIAHEINNPLESAMNLIYLSRTSNSVDDIRSYLGTAESELMRASHIARQTLGFYHDEGVPSPISVQNLIENVLAVYQGKLATARISVECKFEDQSPLTASRGELMQAFSNLVANAIDAMPQGGVLRVQINQRRDPEGIAVTVQDNGRGIRKEYLERVFEPFFTTKGNLGTGIGLWVVKQLVKKRGGEITIASDTESIARGTAVSIFLPLAVPRIR